MERGGEREGGRGRGRGRGGRGRGSVRVEDGGGFGGEKR
jgi:hypothetical protein